MQLSWLVSPLAGSIIGYGTNYLAIKMLFRPHNPKYIGKIKIPFTPGLIPKEKKVLAKQIGTTVEEHLLTENVLVQTLTSSKAKEAFMKIMSTIPTYMEESTRTIGELTNYALDTNIEQNVGTIGEQFVVEIITALCSQEVKDIIIPHISNRITDMINEHISTIISHQYTIDLIEQALRKVLQSENIKENITNYFQQLEEKYSMIETPILDLIPEEYINWVYQFIHDHAVYIGENMIDAVAEGEKAKVIKGYIQKWAEENFNPMVLMFFKIDKIYSGAVEFAKNGLEDEDTRKQFGDLLCQIVNQLLKHSPAFYLKDKNQLPNYKDKIIDTLDKLIHTSNIQSVMGVIEEALVKENGMQEIIEKTNMNEYIKHWLYDRWDVYMNTETAFGFSKNILEGLWKFIGSTPISNLNMVIPNSIIDGLGETAFEYYTKIITNHSKVIADIMDISALVESKINEFSSEEAEEIIISVVHKQLQGITWLGALLGFIIGIIPNLI